MSSSSSSLESSSRPANAAWALGNHKPCVFFVSSCLQSKFTTFKIHHICPPIALLEAKKLFRFQKVCSKGSGSVFNVKQTASGMPAIPRELKQEMTLTTR